MKTLVFLADGFEETEAVVTIDLLRRAEIDVLTVSISNQNEVRGAHGIIVLADVLFDDVDSANFEMIILPGGMPGTKNLEAHVGLRELISKQAAQQKYIAAICAAPSIIGKMELLNGKEAVCFPGFEATLLGASLLDAKVVQSGNIITAKGAGVATEFALKLVEVLKGEARALEIAKTICFT